ncbi:diphosphomevalonate decarboxylase isoform X2 [Bacillus rossius redtenbacheri]
MDSPRIQNCLKEMVARAERAGAVRYSSLAACRLRVCSENNFPTAAGLASSAAGYACLVFTLAKLFGLEGDISGIARLGSGSACRSVLGGFVRWHKGSAADGCDSVASQVVPASHWPELRILILVVNDAQKATGSSVGMKTTVETSELLKLRVAECVPARVDSITEAIREKDFRKFGELTMKDSNQLHAVCLDSFPPLFYMNSVSHAIVNFVHLYNATDLQVAYTFDAGPNACLFVLEENLPRLVATINHVFPPGNNSTKYFQGIPVAVPHINEDVLKLGMEPKEAGSLKYIISTRLGAGPHEVPDHLLTTAGEPRSATT